MAAERDKRLNGLRGHMPVVGDDAEQIGTVLEVFRGLGDIETFGAMGIPPQQEGHDPVRYDYSEAMPGTGTSRYAARAGPCSISHSQR